MESKFVCATCGRGPKGVVEFVPRVYENHPSRAGDVRERVLEPGVVLFRVTLGGVQQYRCAEHTEGTRIRQFKSSAARE